VKIAAGFPTPTSQSCVGYLCVSHSTNPTSVAMSDVVETTLECEPDAHAGEIIPGLPDHVVVTRILRADYFGDDPADLARLRVVSRGMRDAVAAMGLKFEELGEERAVELGCLSALQRLALAGRLSRQELLCGAAAKGGQIEKLKLLRAGGCPWNENTCANAAAGGHLEVLQWAHENECEWNNWTCSNAAKGRHLEVLQWARANSCEWNSDTCANAAEQGHLEIMHWARANGCEWDESTCFGATGFRHLEVLQWARANGCTLDERGCMSLAESGGHEDVVKWLRLRKMNELNLCMAAAKSGQLVELKSLREKNMP
jgi:hypothetical protein